MASGHRSHSMAKHYALLTIVNIPKLIDESKIKNQKKFKNQIIYYG